MAAPANPSGVVQPLANVPVASGSAFASAARSASPTSVLFGTQQAGALVVLLDVTADTGGNTVTVTISGVDRASNKVWTILASAAKGVGTTTVLRVSPQITASANLIAQDIIPSEVQISVVHSDANPITYSVGVHFAD